MDKWLPKIFWNKPDDQGQEKKRFPEWGEFIKQVREAAKGKEISNIEKWYGEELTKHTDWPSNPQISYKTKGWIGWRLLLDKERKRIQEEILEFNEFLKQVKAVAEGKKIANIQEWYDVQRKKHKGWPADPKAYYKNINWPGWIIILEKEFLEWDEFVKQVRIAAKGKRIDNLSRWYKEEYKKHKGWPANPNITYKEKGWKDLYDLLGLEKTEILEWDEFLIEVRNEAQDKVIGDVEKWYKQEQIKHNNWPVKPAQTYAYREKWISWPYLIGREKKEFVFIDFNEFIIQIRSLINGREISNIEEWYNEERKNHSDWPSKPQETYKNKGWADWNFVLGREKKKLLEWEEFVAQVREVTHGKEINNIERWYKKERKKHKNIWPGRPSLYYKDKGWIDWYDLLGAENPKKENIKESGEILQDIDETILNPDTKEGELYQELIGALGLEGARDLLYKMKPESMKISTEKMDGHLSKYIGEYRSPRPIPISDVINKLVPLLDHIGIKQLTIAAIKRECQNNYFKERKATEAPDKKPVDKFFEVLKSKIENITPGCIEVLKEAEDYFYNEMLADVNLPDTVVPYLKLGRPFPDIYQRININEIKKHQRFVIADEMGVGKSASVVLAKESMGKKCALVVVPAEMRSTWSQKYLTDKVSDKGEQVGYFKNGKAPKVLTITKEEDLEKIETEECDYVVVSRESLKDNYMPGLEKLNFDMLIVDEIHEHKRAETGVFSRNLMRLAAKIDTEDKRLVMLSGTPVPNKVEDVVMLLKLLHPEIYSDSLGNISRSIVRKDILAPRINLLPYMQMKTLEDHVEMPNLILNPIKVKLSEEERKAYDNLLQTDDLEPQVKIGLMRKFLLHSESVMDSPLLHSEKIEALNTEINEAFKNKKKIVVFVNDFIEGVMRGDETIIKKLSLPDNIRTFTIDGKEETENGEQITESNKPNRDAVRERFELSQEPSILFLSGKTDAVGVDYSFADHLIFYNEPWNMAEFHQQLARVYRPGLKQDLTCSVMITENTLEEGISQYIEKKQRAINKLLRGIPMSPEERKMLEADADNESENDLEVNPELNKYYKSKYQRIMEFFGMTKERGEKQFFNVMTEQRQKEYAETYEIFGGRSYQDNCARVSASLIRQMSVLRGNGLPFVLDMGSGPAMLRRHMLEYEQNEVVSVDLLRSHFEGKNLGMTAVGSMADNPFPDEEHFDFVNMSLCIQDTAYRPEDKEYERIFAFSEASRVLKTSGRLVLNMGYTYDFRNEDLLAKVLEKFGLRIVPEYTGEVSSGYNFKSRVLVFEKMKYIDENPEPIISSLTKEELRGFEFMSTTRQKEKISSRGRVYRRDRLIPGFSLNQKEIKVQFNQEDQRIFDEEHRILAEVEEMKQNAGGKINNIKKELLIDRGYARLGDKKNSRLFKVIPGDGPITLD